MSQEHRAEQIAASKHPKKHHDGATITKNAAGEETDNSGQLSKVLVSHPRHAGTSIEGAEKMIASQRDSSPALNAALPPNNEALDAPTQAGKVSE